MQVADAGGTTSRAAALRKTARRKVGIVETLFSPRPRIRWRNKNSLPPK
jgi:hypothetical protein